MRGEHRGTGPHTVQDRPARDVVATGGWSGSCTMCSLRFASMSFHTSGFKYFTVSMSVFVSSQMRHVVRALRGGHV